ncbi:hypothetical protein J421_2706 [Gemmatirosa kalamazoonensis]|uniref:Uncharacterized protein n=1 Tax=Gemmatirosa kalamazoonensis TaxID=861299 RepID=W0RLF1_9BACT|nr:hypothetical protein [Gemmatirosa kalamazoonensis]AHG90243.1 hypothetical protein J421_2706 [Gemmatirosa kalamazoonensis]
MFVELIDLLRCPRPHEDTWLVAAAEETVGRHIVRGTLGCPLCEAEYPVVDAVADFGEAQVAGSAADAITADDTMRAAALLGLDAPGTTVVLGGAWQAVAAPLAELAGTRVLLLDPVHAEPLREEVSALRGGGGLPVAANALRGVALDAYTADEPRVAAAVRALAPRGRLVAPADVPVPAGLTELARDARHWVAERDASSESRPIALSRPRRSDR